MRAHLADKQYSKGNSAGGQTANTQSTLVALCSVFTAPKNIEVLFCFPLFYFVLLLIPNMAGLAAGWRIYLTGTLGLSAEQARAFIGQGYDIPASFFGAGDEDIKAACVNCKKPGGMIPNPIIAMYDDPNDVPENVPDEVPDPGVAIGHGHA